MEQEFLDVIKDQTPATIITINAHPASVVNTWSHYINVVDDHTLLIPSAGMHSIENDLTTDNHLTVTIGSYKVEGSQGMGRGYHIHGTGKFATSGANFDRMKQQFDWIRAVLVVTIDDIQQKI